MAYPTDPSSPADLLSLLPQKFANARQSGQLFFFESTAKDVYTPDGRRFNVRCCPALLDKAKAKSDALAAIRAEPLLASSSTSTSSPTSSQPSNVSASGSPEAKRQKTSDGTTNGEGDIGQNSTAPNAEPFRPPYVPELYVGCLAGLEGEEGMSVLLNKYSLLPEHFLLCPPSPAPQHLPPTPPQLALAYLLLLSAARHPTRPRRLLGFYNAGAGAGASQAWRHIQFIDASPAGGVGVPVPVSEWVQDAGVGTEGRDKASIHPSLPYLHIMFPLPGIGGVQWPPASEAVERLVDRLAVAMMAMLDLGIDAVRRGNGKRDGGWNLLMTLDHLHLIPRSSPSYPLPAPHPPLELNSLGYAGLLLVRSPDEEAALLAATSSSSSSSPSPARGPSGPDNAGATPLGLMEVLRYCGVPREWGEEAVRAMEAVHGGAGGWDELA